MWLYYILRFVVQEAFVSLAKSAMLNRDQVSEYVHLNDCGRIHCVACENNSVVSWMCQSCASLSRCMQEAIYLPKGLPIDLSNGPSKEKDKASSGGGCC